MNEEDAMGSVSGKGSAYSEEKQEEITIVLTSTNNEEVEIHTSDCTRVSVKIFATIPFYRT